MRGVQIVVVQFGFLCTFSAFSAPQRLKLAPNLYRRDAENADEAQRKRYLL